MTSKTLPTEQTRHIFARQMELIEHFKYASINGLQLEFLNVRLSLPKGSEKHEQLLIKFLQELNKVKKHNLRIGFQGANEEDKMRLDSEILKYLLDAGILRFVIDLEVVNNTYKLLKGYDFNEDDESERNLSSRSKFYCTTISYVLNSVRLRSEKIEAEVRNENSLAEYCTLFPSRVVGQLLQPVGTEKFFYVKSLVETHFK